MQWLRFFILCIGCEGGKPQQEGEAGVGENSQPPAEEHLLLTVPLECKVVIRGSVVVTPLLNVNLCINMTNINDVNLARLISIMARRGLLRKKEC